MKIKISATPANEITMANMQNGVLYVIISSQHMDRTYPHGGVIYRDNFGRLVLFHHIDGEITVYPSPSKYTDVKLAVYTKPLVLEN